MKGSHDHQKMSPLPSKLYHTLELGKDVESFLKVYSPQGSSLAEGEMQLRENKWYCRIDCKTYLKAIMLILLIAILTATLLILFVKTNKQPIGEIYTEKVLVQTTQKSEILSKHRKPAKSEKYCEIRAKELSQFNGCSIPEWMPKDLVNTHGENMLDSLSSHMWGSKKPSKENYAQIFETDCNKHDICYGCGSHYNLSRADCDKLFYKDMVQTCENTYSSSWLDVIKNSFGKSKYNTDQKELCVQKAGHFRQGVEVGGEENYSGNESWCEDPCIVQYLLGGNSIQSNNEGEIDCGNGKRADSCGNCKQIGVNAEQWCGGDCEWDDFFSQCNQKLTNSDDDEEEW